jgi:uroporphyrinogen III methyltransferase/synthase
MRTGTVYLVGAGPGNSELLTVKAARLIGEADLVAYDDLIDPGTLALAKADATLLAVGYRGVNGSAAPAPIHPQILAAARQGQTVVRLKCGDPMVFGRGGDEALILRDHGVPYEIVPGVTAALGAAAYAGIPLTHRHVTSGFHVVTAHTAKTAGRPEASAGKQTIVLYMARHHLASYCQDLIRAGHPADLPAAFVVSATTPAQRVLVGTLVDLADKVAADESDGPGLAIIGETVAMRGDIAWFDESRQLAGHRVLVARARPGASRLAERLRALGADVVETPLVHALPLASYDELDEEVRHLARHDALAFACAEGVAAFLARLDALGIDSRELPLLPVIAVGEAAARRLTATGWRPELSLPGSCEEAVAAHAAAFDGRRVLLIAASGGRPNLVDALLVAGAKVTVAAAYRHVHRFVRIVAPPPELIILPSSSAAQPVLSADLGFDACRVPMVAIGPLTEKAARAAGAVTVHRAAHDDLDEVITLATRLLSGAPAVPPRRAGRADVDGTSPLFIAGRSP